MASLADYLTLESPAMAEFTVKGSRFIGIAIPCTTEEEMRAGLAEVTVRFPNATHYCYGSVYGGNLRIERSSDNGEPSGTAAKPIMAVIKGRSLTDVLVVVVRYFGGTLLGTGGLVHAYTQGADSALDAGKIVLRKACNTYSLTFGYADRDRIVSKCTRFFLGQPRFEYEMNITMTVDIPLASTEEFLQKVSEVTERKCIPLLVSSGFA